MIELKPLLRFDCFNESWIKGNLKDTLILNYGKDHKHLKSGSYPVLGSGGIMRYVDSFLYDKPSVLIGRKGTIDNPLYINEPFWTVDTLFYTEIRDNFVPYFIYLLALKVKWKKYNEATGVPSLNTSGIYSVPVTFPDKLEQQKIADFLTSVDTKISQLTEKHRLLKDYKKGVMQQIFSQQIRFKDDEGKAFPEWDYRKGNDVFIAISNKKHSSNLPILAITQEHGAIPRNLIGYEVQVTDSSISGYKVVKKGDFIISLRSFQGGIEYSNYHGICSPAYIILRPKLKVSDKFFRYYLKTHNFLQDMKKRLEGIRDGKILSYKYFSEIDLPFPSVEEQQKIAQFLQSLDKKIDAVNEQIEQTKLFKKGLLQQMFV